MKSAPARVLPSLVSPPAVENGVGTLSAEVVDSAQPMPETAGQTESGEGQTAVVTTEDFLP